MAKKDLKTQKPKKSVKRRFNIALFVVYLLCIILSLPVVYFVTKNEVYQQAEKELTLLVDMVGAVRNVVREDTRPYFLPKGEFFPVVVSSTVMAKTVATKFLREQPNYYIKIASDNPLNNDNLPQPLEKELLRQFRANRGLEKVVDTGIVDKQSYLVSAAPAVVSDGCIRCHGRAKDAPAEITDTYGTEHGFNWSVGTVMGASVVGVPLANVNEIVLERGLYTVAALTLLFGFILIIMNWLVRSTIITPLLAITEAAYAVSHGDTKRSIEMKREDELGQLAHSFELMRNSILVAEDELNR